ncbi:hypothetical protein BIV57_07005 [Mangrovactinospora gilvigrisea]|uniref:Uncharacterized protein n=1 Tax=Mangrovactinospora gilvigrisea TaxID=1428644 RepID=A0A1J7BHL6_9ACTN|nr:DUF5819 family protein [Mangrovactinospora gilvigrisea]OIV38187.1 hypothetical protein BIV57_07005 [Mangrovactinospora gilvigrisea]
MRASLSRPARAVLGLAGCALLLAAGGHLALTFLAVAPRNAASSKAADAVNDYIYPELEQNWQLFAPNPLARNETVWARATVRTGAGDFRTTPWRDLTAEDVAAIRGNPFPGHLDQNQLRRAWDAYGQSVSGPERGKDAHGVLLTTYLRRVVLQRLQQHVQADADAADAAGDRIIRVQVRGRFALIGPPAWDTARASERGVKPWFRTMPWWDVEPGDRIPGSRP